MSKNHQRDRSQMKGGFVLFVICIFVAIMSVCGFEDTESTSSPHILAGIPNAFDLRVLPSYKFANFASTQQGICVGGNFAKTISQTVSHIYSKKLQSDIRVSAQQLLDCSIPSQDNICYQNNLQQINYALAYASYPGLTSERCYPFKALDGPGNCSKICTSDNSSVQVRYSIASSQVNHDADSLTKWIGKNGPIVIIMDKRDGFNYYHGGILNNTGETSYGSIALQVVGWKDKGNTLVAKSTFGPTWGINGYVHIALQNPTIQKYIGFTLHQEELSL